MFSPISLLNPYNLQAQMTTVSFQVMGDGFPSDTENNPTFTVEDFFDFMPHFDTPLMDDGGQLRRLFNRYVTIVNAMLPIDWFADAWYFMMAHGIAHYLQLSINRLKNIDNETTYTTTKEYASNPNQAGGKQVTINVKSLAVAGADDWGLTQYGVVFYGRLKPYLGWDLRGVY